MLRQTKWQHEVSDNVSWHQDEALNATLFLLRNMGPTSFSLIEEGQDKKLKVNLGDPHTCTCDVYKKERNPCKHICWLILKKFKWPRNNELSYQHGLVEREINQLLQGPIRKSREIQKISSKISSDVGKKGITDQRTISEVDICPICQDEFLDNHLPVTYCRYGCGNSVHLKCMKIWAEHQRQSAKDDDIKCPICREKFGSYYELLEELRNASGGDSEGHRLDVHFSTSCNACNMCPIKGKCYKCMTCNSVHLCNACFHGNKHRQHAFEFRIKRTHRWRPAKSRHQTDSHLSIINDLSLRDINENDYDLLLQLDSPQGDGVPVDLCGLPEHIINSLPLMKVRIGAKLLAPGKQCRICLRCYDVGEYVRKLPDCKHIFHRECIDKWLSEDHRRCPIDQKLVSAPYRRQSSTSSSNNNEFHDLVDNSLNDLSQLMIPGIGIAKLHAASHNKKNSNQKSGLHEHSLVQDRTTGNSTYSDVLHGFNSLSVVREKNLSYLPYVRPQQKTKYTAEPMNRIAKGSLIRRQIAAQTVPACSYSDLWLTGNSSLVPRRNSSNQDNTIP